MMQTPVIVTFANQKGGVGKTTLCVTFANYLLTKGVNVVVIDCDFQHSILKCRRSDIRKFGEQAMPYDVVEREATDRQEMIELIEKLHNDPSIEVAVIDSPGSLKAAELGLEKYVKSIWLGRAEYIRDNFHDKSFAEIAKALGKKCDLLILDEPTAALNDRESAQLLELMLQLKAQGITCIIISHKLNEISYVADSITIIRDGKSIETLEKGKDDFSEERIIKGMVGRELTNRYPKREDCPIGDVILEVKNWNVYHPDDAERQMLKDINIQVRAGEVVGLAGLMGAGRTELAMSLFGRSYGQKISGDILIKGEKVDLKDVRTAIKHRMAYVSEDRKTYGLVLIDSIKFNMTLSALREFFSKKGIVDHNLETVRSEEYRTRINVKTNSIDQTVGSLSGGNQQKVVLAKWMLTEPDVLILDEPTRGIDVGAKYEIYCVINELAKAGKAVIVISSEMPEIIGTCDRTYVINEGEIAGELKGDEITQEAIMACIMAHNRKEEVEA